MKESEILTYAYEKGWLNDKGKDVHIDYLLGKKVDYSEQIQKLVSKELMTKTDYKDLAQKEDNVRD